MLAPRWSLKCGTEIRPGPTVRGANGWFPPWESAKKEATVLTGRTLRIFRIVIVVLNIVVAVLSVRRGDTAVAVISIAVAVLFLIQVIRPSIDGKGGDRDDRTPPSS